MKLNKLEWVTKYGGEDILTAQKMTVIPCIDCGDSVCHGWMVVNTTTIAKVFESVIRANEGIIVSVVDPGKGQSKRAYVGSELDGIKIHESHDYEVLVKKVLMGEITSWQE